MKCDPEPFLQVLRRDLSDGIGFSGTKQGVRPAQLSSATMLLTEHFYPGRKFHHGDCKGADVQIACVADKIGYVVVCHPPKNPKHRGWFPYNDIMLPEDEYIQRDRDIVNETKMLIACPHTPYEITRSGTWTTVRYARELKRPYWIIHPDGSVQY